MSPVFRLLDILHLKTIPHEFLKVEFVQHNFYLPGLLSSSPICIQHLSVSFFLCSYSSLCIRFSCVWTSTVISKVHQKELFETSQYNAIETSYYKLILLHLPNTDIFLKMVEKIISTSGIICQHLWTKYFLIQHAITTICQFDEVVLCECII